jgi:flagellar protein FliO/FliZ
MEVTEILRFGAALIFVLALIGAAAYAMRAFGFATFATRRPGDRRLSVTESMSIDARRRLLLIRRDDEEYLVLLSPQGDVILGDRLKMKAVPEIQSSAPVLRAVEMEARS